MATTKARVAPLRLLVRPSPLKGESLRGFLLRVSERNGYAGKIDLNRYLTGQGMGYQLSESVLENTAQSLDLDLEQVRLMSYRRVSTKAVHQCHVWGHAVSVAHLRGTKPAVCPQCLAEQQAISGLWDLRAVCACTRHGNWLIDRCPGCGNQLKWGRPGVAKCNCGFDLCQASTEVAPADVLAMTAFIHEIVLNELPTYPEKALGFPEALRQTPLSEILSLFRYAVEGLLPQHPSRKEAEMAGSEDFIKYQLAARLLARFLSHWPNEMPFVLAEINADHDGGAEPAVTLTRTQFDARFGHAIKTMKHPKFACLRATNFVKGAVLQFREDHLISNGGEGQFLNPSVVYKDARGARVLIHKDAAEAFGWPNSDTYPNEMISFETFLLSKDPLNTGIWGPKTVKEMLGCSSSHLKELGDLEPLYPKVGCDYLLEAWKRCSKHLLQVL